ncbi:MAG TPA: AAA family ATPase [Bacilli bacterium]|nr:AAA family ATPase [Bacilli bacterium]
MEDTTPEKINIYLRRLKIENYKAIDELELFFPMPTLPNDPDVMVIGSKNGIGKTSILEACSLLFFSALHGSAVFESIGRELLENKGILELLVRAGTERALIKGEFYLDDISFEVELTLSPISGIHIKFDDMRKDLNCSVKRLEEMSSTKRVNSQLSPLLGSNNETTGNLETKKIRKQVEKLLASIFGENYEPLILRKHLYFHAYRKVQEGSLSTGELINQDSKDGKGSESIGSVFKMEIMRALMSQGGLFENLGSKEESIEQMSKLNELMKEFAGGTIEKLRQNEDGSLEFRVTPLVGSDTYSFDGLSSGQKEIISTLFLIWKHTRENPGLVLIDEPELHLNAEWHRKFIRHLMKMAPENQYIIATHSEDIFDSVEEDRRIMIAKE